MDVTYEQLEYGLAAGLLVLSMVGMGTTLAPADFLRVLRMPVGIGLVLVLQLVVAPSIAWCVATALQVPAGIALGMILITALPGGSYTNLMTYLGRGNVALSVTATTICTALCVATAPLVLRTFGGVQTATGLEMPVGQILLEIVVFLLLPLSFGMSLKKLAPDRAPRIGRAALRVSLVLLVILIGASVVAGRLQAAAVGWRAPVAVGLLAFLTLWVSYGLLRVCCRQSLDDTFTIGVEVVVRNGNLGLLIKASLFPAGRSDPAVANGVLYVVLLYAAMSLIVAAIEVYARRKQVGILYSRR